MDSPAPVDLSDLSAQLDAWRQSHRKRARIPDHFYKTAVTLLDRYSVAAICRETRLRPASLRKHAAPAHPLKTSSEPQTKFLHLNAADLLPPHAPTPAPNSTSVAKAPSRLLFERVDGSRLTLNFSSADPAHLEALCLTLLRS